MSSDAESIRAEVAAEEVRQKMDTVLREAIHETSISRCGQFSDTCPDWPLAHELGRALRDNGYLLRQVT